MRFKHTLAFGLVLALPAFFLQCRAESNDGILNRLHHHDECDAKQSVVRLPAQEIRVETTAPRITVNQAGPSHRVRGFFPAAMATPAFMPIMQGPFVATVLSTTATSSAPSAASNALRALQEMEAQGHEVATQLAAHKASTDYLNTLQKSMQTRMSLTFSAGATTSSELQQTLDRLEKRISDIERLLLVHDQLIMKLNPPAAK